MQWASTTTTILKEVKSGGAVKAFNMTMGYKMERVAPVPEPEVYALLIGNMALVAGIARRRRKSS